MTNIHIDGNGYEHSTGRKHWSCFALVSDDRLPIVVRVYGSNTRNGLASNMTEYGTIKEAQAARSNFAKKKMKRSSDGENYSPSLSLTAHLGSVAELMDHLADSLPQGHQFKSSELAASLMGYFSASSDIQEVIKAEEENKAEAARVKAEIRKSEYQEVDEWGMFA